VLTVVTSLFSLSYPSHFTFLPFLAFASFYVRSLYDKHTHLNPGTYIQHTHSYLCSPKRDTTHALIERDAHLLFLYMSPFCGSSVKAFLLSLLLIFIVVVVFYARHLSLMQKGEATICLQFF